MADSSWRCDLVEQARKWPASLRAQHDGHWQLYGATRDVYREFRLSAWGIIHQLDVAGTARARRPMDTLLYRLQAYGHYVGVRQFARHSVSSADRHTIVRISPLRDSLTEYLLQGCPEVRHVPSISIRSPAASMRNGAGPGGKLRKTDTQAMGQAKAAQKNRQREARQRIIEAFQHLGISCTAWPDFVRAYWGDPQQRTEYTQSQLSPPFQPPEFDRLSQSPENWIKLVDQEWKEHRSRLLELCQNWVNSGVDEEIPAAKRSRGPGSPMNRGKNTAVGRRYEWAAKYLARIPLKEIAAQDCADPSTVGRNAREILRQANWLEPAKIKGRATVE